MSPDTIAPRPPGASAAPAAPAPPTARTCRLLTPFGTAIVSIFPEVAESYVHVTSNVDGAHSGASAASAEAGGAVSAPPTATGSTSASRIARSNRPLRDGVADAARIRVQCRVTVSSLRGRECTCGACRERPGSRRSDEPGAHIASTPPARWSLHCGLAWRDLASSTRRSGDPSSRSSSLRSTPHTPGAPLSSARARRTPRQPSTPGGACRLAAILGRWYRACDERACP
jgi:hypothetical protein